MATLDHVTDTATNMSKSLTITSGDGKTITLDTDKKYVEKDIVITMIPQPATPTFDGGALNGQDATATFTNITANTTSNNGISILTHGTAGRDAVLYNGAVNGWVSVNDNTQASAKIDSSSWDGKTYYVTAITVPQDKLFTITTIKDNNGLDTTSDLTLNNNEYRRVMAKNTGTIYVRHETQTGSLFGRAYDEDTDHLLISWGGWHTTQFTPNTNEEQVAYGKVTMPKMAVIKLKATGNGNLTYQPSITRKTFTITNVTDASGGTETTTAPTSGVYVKVSSAANTGTLTVTPGVAAAGYGTTTSSDPSLYKPTIGASASKDTYVPIAIGSAKVNGTSITAEPTISFTANNQLTAKYNKTQAVTGTATAGWVSSVTQADVTTSGSATVNSLSLPRTYNFTLTTEAGTSSDAASGYTITNNAYRTLTITNNANATTKITNNTSATVEITKNSGTTKITSGISSNTTQGTITITAYPASGTTLDSAETIVSNGRWNTNNITNVTAETTYYGKTIVRMVSGSLGGSASAGKATAAITNVNSMATITTLTNLTAGTDYWAVKATATGTAGSYTPNYTVSASGWLNSTVSGSAQSVSVTGDSTGKTIYIPKAKFTVSNNLVYCSSAGYIPKGSTSSGVGTISAGKVTSGSAEITALTYAYNSTNSNFTITGSANVSAPAVNTAGYISSSTGTRSPNNGGATVSTTVAKVKLKATSSSTLTYQPAIKRQAFSISGVTDASNAAETTTAPTSGVYVKVNSAANTGTITVSPAVATAGYGTTTNFDATDYTGTIGAKASSDTYIPIKTATPAFDGGTISGTTTSDFTNASTDTSNTSGVVVTTSGKASRTAVLFNGAVKGWVDKADNAQASAAINNTTITGATYYITGVNIKASKNFNITIPNGSATSTITLNFDVDENNNVLVT